eukprot:scaffold37281_cov95-Skeletonema_marinoi.AAC.1
MASVVGCRRPLWPCRHVTSVDTVSDTSESIKHPGTEFRIKSELCEDRSKLSRAVKRATKAQVWRPKQAFHC